MNRQIFYQKAKVKLFPSLRQSTLNGINAIVDEWEKQGISDNRQLAYILATVYHECARKMQPIEEFGKGKGKAYGSKIKSSRKHYSTPNKLYYGRGFVQLTWYENYVKAGKKLGIDLLNTPELALELSTASTISSSMPSSINTSFKIAIHPQDGYWNTGGIMIQQLPEEDVIDNDEQKEKLLEEFLKLNLML